MEKRNNARIPLITCGKVATPLSDERGVVYTANVSRQGLCFFSKASLPVESELLLELELGPLLEPVVTEHLHGRVLWKRDWGELAAHGIQLSSPLSPVKTPRLLELALGPKALSLIDGSSRDPAAPFIEALTEREGEITRLIAQGYNNREMAQRLSISTKTVETHRAHIYSKMGVHNAVQLLRALEKSGHGAIHA